MKKFIVVCDEYERFGGGAITLDCYESPDLDTLIRETLEPGLCPNKDSWQEEDGVMPSPSEWLMNANGDGMNYYIIKELLPDGTLGEELPSEKFICKEDLDQ